MTSPPPLRILSVLHSLEPGGVERDLLRFTRAWREAGLDARIALGRWEGRLTEEAPETIPYIIPPKGRLARIDTESLWMMQQLPAIVRRERPDVLFFPSNGLMAVAAVTKLRMGKACPPIVLRPSNSLDERHSSPLRRTLSRMVMRAHSRIYDAVVAMAPPVREEIIVEMGVAPARVETIMNASMTMETARARPRRATLRAGISSPSAALLPRRISRCCCGHSSASPARRTGSPSSAREATARYWRALRPNSALRTRPTCPATTC